MSNNLVLDYSHYVEVIDREEDAVLSSYVTDIHRKADQFGLLENGVSRFFYYGDDDMNNLEQLNNYKIERLQLHQKMRSHNNCPNCKSNLREVHKEHRDSKLQEIVVKECPACGWWLADDHYSLEVKGGSCISYEICRRGLLREFSVGGSEIPIESLRKYIFNHSEGIYLANPDKMEHLVGSVFSEHMNCEAIHVGGPNDDGIDLVLIDGNQKYLVQVKRRSSQDKAESVKGIREFVGAMVLNSEMKGIYVTTAPRFSPNARETANRAIRLGAVDEIKLVDGKRLLEVCDLTRNNIIPSWEKFPILPECDEFGFYTFKLGS